MASGRLSYSFDFKGPAMSVDTACSSSLVATHLASLHHKSNAIWTSLVSGVNILVTQDTTLMFQKAGMLSPDGRCKTLDASADGYVRGEFCGSLCLQACDPNAPSENQSPVSILGTAVNQDGRSSALTAPNGPAQQSVIRAALASTAGVEAGDVSMLQMHGTGTPLGDPIEVGALHATLMQSRSTDGLGLTLASGKTCVGHTEPGAGAAGLIHLMDAMRDARAAPILHLSSVNPHLHHTMGAKAGSAFSLPRSSAGHTQPGEGQGMSGGVSSFAFQGTNSHAVVGCNAAVAHNADDKQALPWSADRCWILPPMHSLVALCTDASAASGVMAFETVLSSARHEYLWDHCVDGRALYPGAGYLEMSAALARMVTDRSLVSEKGAIPAPLVLPVPAVQAVRTVLCTRLDLIRDAQYTISSGILGKASSMVQQQHFRGYLGWLASPATHDECFGKSKDGMSFGNDVLRACSAIPVDSLHLYHSMHAVGLQYRRAFQVLHSVRTCGHDRGCTHSMVGGQADSEIDGMNVHPSALDGCLQLGATGAIAGATSGKGAQQTRVPAGMEAFVVHERPKTGSLRGLAQTNHASTKMSRSHHMLLSLH